MTRPIPSDIPPDASAQTLKTLQTLQTLPPIPIFFKPDALRGTHATADATRISDFFTGLLLSLSEDPIPVPDRFRCATSLHAHTLAYRQITERAVSEVSFRDPVLHPHQCTMHLTHAIHSYQTHPGTYAVTGVIRHALVAFLFSVAAERTWTLSRQDITRIYQPALLQQPALLEVLCAYLEQQDVVILLVAGTQSHAVLQRIKTYARYFFRYQPGEQHRVENLLHVSEKDDADFLRSLLL